MRRIYACLAILTVIVLLAAFSTARVHRFTEEMNQTVEQAEQALEQNDYPAALQAMEEGAQLCEEMHRQMMMVLRTEDFLELESNLRAAAGYLEQDAREEAAGELRRASVQLENLDRLAHRWL